jgi:hypothetical protein
MNREILNQLLEDVQRRKDERLAEYKKSLRSTIESATNYTDLENVSATAVRYASVIAKFEAEIQTLQGMMLYIKE